MNGTARPARQYVCGGSNAVVAHDLGKGAWRPETVNFLISLGLSMARVLIAVKLIHSAA